MRRLGGVCFRILYPNPFDFPQASSFPLEITCAAEFSSRSAALKLAKRFSSLPFIRHIQFEKNSTFKVIWLLQWVDGPKLSRILQGFPELALQMDSALKNFMAQSPWVLKGRGNRKFKWNQKTQIMGVLNITPDSFSDGGRYSDPSLAADRALQMQEEGADWVDVGGESSRPGARTVTASEEKKRILPVLKACRKILHIPVSVDTYKSEVARAAVEEGAQMINDIGALRFDPGMGKCVAHLKVPVVLMHMQGKPGTMQKNPVYQDVVGDVLAFFRDRIAFARRCGISEDRLLIDPGFGFGKTPWHNMELTRRLWEFKILGRPIVMGPSRKSTLGFLLGGLPPEERVEATGAAVTASILKGADFVRVHDVQSMSRVVKIADAIRYDRGLSRP
jgi:dihydropteroate synthase